MLRAFGNDYGYRMRWLEAVQWHADWNLLRQNFYSNREEGLEWRGCFIGCAWRSHFMASGQKLPEDCDRPTMLASVLGVPAQLTHAWDAIFELLPPEAAREFAVPLSKSIRCGADLSDVWRKMCLWMLLKTKAQQDVALDTAQALLLTLLVRHGETEVSPKEFGRVRRLVDYGSYLSLLASSMHWAPDTNWALRQFVRQTDEQDPYQLADKMLALLRAA